MVIGLAMVAAVVQAPSATAKLLSGSIEPSGSASLSVKFKKVEGAKFRVYRWQFTDIPMACEGGGTPAVVISGKVTVRNSASDVDRFDDAIYEGDIDDPAFASELSGKLVRPGFAKGTIHVRGSAIPLVDGESARCDSGLLSWTTSK